MTRRAVALAALVTIVLALFPRVSLAGGVELVSSSESGVTVRCDFGDVTIDQTESGGVAYDVVRVEGAGPIGVPGAPELPGVRVRLAVPDCDRVSFRIVTQGTRTEPGVRVVPSPSIVPTSPGAVSAYRVLEGPLYEEDAVWPPAAATVSEPVSFSRQRVVEVVLHPCQYNPATEELVVHDAVVVELSFSGVRRAAAPTKSSPRLETLYSEALLNYESGRAWRLAPEKRFRETEGDYFTTSANWAKLLVTERGLHRIDRDALESAGIDPSAIDPGTVRVFFGGGLPLPESPAEPRPEWMTECAILVDGESDGTFDAGDAIVFYGLGPDGWASDFAILSPEEPYYENPHASENVYWLTWEEPGHASGFTGSPLRMQQDDLQESASPVAVSDYLEASHFELNVFPTQGRSDNWFWYSMALTGVPETRYFHELLDHVVTDSTGVLRCRVDGDSRTWNPTDHHAVFTLNGVEAYDAYWDGYDKAQFEVSGMSFNEGYNTLQIEAPRDLPDVDEDFMLIDWYEYLYWRTLWTDAEPFAFGSSGRTGVLEYSLGGVEASGLDVYKVLDKYTVLTVPGVELDGGTATFQDEVADTASYIAVPVGSYIEPTIEVDAFGDLRVPDGSDYLMIAHDDFLQETGRLAGYRQTQAGGGFEVRVVSVSDVYDEFSWGLTDPTAIRDYLMHTHENSATAPTHALLVGDASADIRNYVSSLPSYVPTYYRRVWDAYGYYRVWPAESWFVGFEEGQYAMSMALGRLSVRSTSELEIMVDKIVRYETETVQGPWKNRAVIVGDDEYVGADMDDDCCEYYHTEQAEQIDDEVLPWSLDRRKIYLMEYERVATGKKPAARSALIDTWNDGALILNYTGHGSEIVMAHEDAFLFDDVSLLTNAERLPLYFASSCRLNKFDQETVDSLGEMLAKSASGGSIVSIGSTRDSGASQNSAFNRDFLSHVFGGQREAPTVHMDVGSAFAAAFSVGYSWSNNTKFMIVGDPAVRLVAPEGGGSISPEGLSPMRRSETVEFEGQGNGAVEELDGVALLLVTESADTTGYLHDYPGDPLRQVDYDLPGDTIFTGPVAVSGGVFDGGFVVSNRAAEGRFARVRAYCYDGVTDGSMSLEGAVIRDSLDVSDATGPSIDMGFQGGSTSVLPGAELSISLSDEHGINLVDRNDVDGIVLTVDAGADSVLLTDSFAYDFGSYTSGTIDYELPSLGPGGHSIRVAASDNAGNRSSESLWFDVVSSTEFKIRKVANHPNPFGGDGNGGTDFLFELPVEADVRIDVFTVGGRLIRSIDGVNGSPGANQVHWDGRDEQNDELANGVYLYRIYAVSRAYRGDRAEAIGRAVVMR